MVEVIFFVSQKDAPVDFPVESVGIVTHASGDSPPLNKSAHCVRFGSMNDYEHAGMAALTKAMRKNPEIEKYLTRLMNEVVRVNHILAGQTEPTT